MTHFVVKVNAFFFVLKKILVDFFKYFPKEKKIKKRSNQINLSCFLDDFC